MTKRLSDTEALKSQGIKEAGIELASCKSPDYLGPNHLEPAYQSADYAVDAGKRRKEAEERMNSPFPVSLVSPSERAENRRKTGAGNSALSNAVKICRE